MRGYIFRFLILFVAVLLQSTLLEKFKIGEAKPDLILIITLYFGFKGGIMSGQVTGFFGGLLEDIVRSVGSLTSGDFGTNMLIKTLMGFASGNVYRRIFSDNIVMTFLLVFIATLIKGILYIIVVQISIKEFQFEHVLKYVKDSLIIEIVLNSMLSPFLFNLLDKLNLSLEKEV